MTARKPDCSFASFVPAQPLESGFGRRPAPGDSLDTGGPRPSHGGPMGASVDRVLLIRHLAICAAAGAAYLLRTELAIGYTALGIVVAGSLANFGAYVLRGLPALARGVLLASPAIGVASWAALVAATGGVGSPFIAGLWLEVVLSAMALRARGVGAVTAGSIGALWAQQGVVGLPGAWASLGLHTGFLAAAGAVTFAVTLRWGRVHSDLVDRLAELEARLEDERGLSRLGEGAGRLAHGLKNAVHSLRGFAGLIEPGAGQRAAPALAGLRTAIDDLEALARATLETAAEREPGDGAVAGAVRDVAPSYPEVRFEADAAGPLPPLAAPPAVLREVLAILLANAGDAMDRRGTVSIETELADSRATIAVRDRGPGIDPDARARIFELGYSTKDGGTGFGLFLGRRLVEACGGELSVDSKAGEGAVFRVSLPVRAG